MKPSRCVWIALSAGLLMACSSSAGEKMALASSAFPAGGEIPRKYTCQGANVSPPLAWRGVPAGAKSLVLIIDDPDAPDPKAPKMVWHHWLVYDLPPGTRGLAEGAAASGLPAGARQGKNSWKKTAYGGPCPPIGRHRYFLKLFALDVVLADRQAPDEKALLAAMEGHVLARAELIGTYRKTKE